MHIAAEALSAGGGGDAAFNVHPQQSSRLSLRQRACRACRSQSTLSESLNAYGLPIAALW